MSKRDRDNKPKSRLIAGFIVTIGFLVSVGAIYFGLTKQAEYERRSYQRSSEYTEDTYGPAYNSCLRLPAGSQHYCIAEANEKRRENRRNENDLVAQQTMSIWTFLMGCAAIIGMLLSAVGVYLVYSTFQETKRTADIAMSSVDQAERTLILTQRALMHVKPVAITMFGGKGQGHTQHIIGFQLRNQVENTGNTEAKNIVWEFGAELFSGTLPDGFKYDTSCEGTVDIIPAKAKPGHFGEVTLGADVIPLVESGEKNLFVWGSVSYGDIFTNVTHTAEFCFRIVIHGRLPDGQLHIKYERYGARNRTYETDPNQSKDCD